jgi:cyanophycinase-like exopeptidase
MVSTHRELVSRLAGNVVATVVDTPYGFQENAPELAERAVGYFSRSVNIDVTVAGLTRLDGDAVDPVAVERGLRHLAEATWVFAGPGSPTYALRQWRGSPVHDLLAQKLRDGGIVTFASAAALTLGSHTVPVYEIYKVGEEPRWEEGLDLLGELGIHAAVVPHWDNAEGGHHDTRFCYLGERRLEHLEGLLPDRHFVLGIDEHTALVLDLDADSASVTGRGTVTIRVRGSERVFPAGETFGLELLRSPGTSADSHPRAGSTKVVGDGTAPERVHVPDSGDGNAAGHGSAFRAALESRDAEGAVRAALALEQDLGDMEGQDLTSARAELRAMISSLGDAAVGGVQDPREVVGPFVNAILEVRAIVRAEKRFDLSDVIRDTFDRLGVEVRDTPDGPQWQLR